MYSGVGEAELLYIIMVQEEGIIKVIYYLTLNSLQRTYT